MAIHVEEDMSSVMVDVRKGKGKVIDNSVEGKNGEADSFRKNSRSQKASNARAKKNISAPLYNPQ